jgi:Protein of unknown function (DUF1648)
MSRTAPLVLALLVAAAVAIVLATSASLPATVATHFAAGGRANGFMTRIGYQVFYCTLIVLLPLVVYAGLAWLPAHFPRLVNLPNRDYWLAQPRRESSIATLRVFGVALAAIIVAMFVGVHMFILEAHERTPATLAEGPFVGLVIGFVVVIVILVILLYVRFRAPG